jgi:hypothetical protein
MKKVLFVFIVLVASLVLALRHFRPDFSWFVEASGDDSTGSASASLNPGVSLGSLLITWFPSTDGLLVFSLSPLA